MRKNISYIALFMLALAFSFANIVSATARKKIPRKISSSQTPM